MPPALAAVFTLQTAQMTTRKCRLFILFYPANTLRPVHHLVSDWHINDTRPQFKQLALGHYNFR